MDAFAPGGAEHPVQGQTGHNDAGHGQVGYPGGPQPPNRPRFPWFPFAVVAAILLAGALIAAAIFFRDSRQSSDLSKPSAAATATTKPTKSSGGSTCAAWTTAQIDMGQVTRMPPGWVYGNPGIDQLADSRAAQINKILNVFETQIAPEPADVAAAAHLFIAKQRVEVRKLTARQPIDDGDVAAVEGAGVALNRSCGTG
ncbi:hypothetical protein [Mycobacterium angelicum]|nr:hypothetical protein [Mycobacterium angelicum]MCV7200176.1 hypothetical protein [Mycobacterium angelicum]